MADENLSEEIKITQLANAAEEMITEIVDGVNTEILNMEQLKNEPNEEPLLAQKGVDEVIEQTISDEVGAAESAPNDGDQPVPNVQDTEAQSMMTVANENEMAAEFIDREITIQTFKPELEDVDGKSIPAIDAEQPDEHNFEDRTEDQVPDITGTDNADVMATSMDGIDEIPISDEQVNEMTGEDLIHVSVEGEADGELVAETENIEEINEENDAVLENELKNETEEIIVDAEAVKEVHEDEIEDDQLEGNELQEVESETIPEQIEEPMQESAPEVEAPTTPTDSAAALETETLVDTMNEITSDEALTENVNVTESIDNSLLAEQEESHEVQEEVIEGNPEEEQKMSVASQQPEEATEAPSATAVDGVAPSSRKASVESVTRKMSNTVDKIPSRKSSAIEDKAPSRKASALEEKLPSRKSSTVDEKVPSRKSSTIDEKVPSRKSSTVDEKVPSRKSSTIDEKLPSRKSSTVDEKVPSRKSSAVEEKVPSRKSSTVDEKVPSRKSSTVDEKAPSRKTSALEEKAPSRKTSALEEKAPSRKTSALEEKAPSRKTSALEEKAPSRKTSTIEEKTHSRKSSAVEEKSSSRKVSAGTKITSRKASNEEMRKLSKNAKLEDDSAATTDLSNKSSKSARAKKASKIEKLDEQPEAAAEAEEEVITEQAEVEQVINDSQPEIVAGTEPSDELAATDEVLEEAIVEQLETPMEQENVDDESLVTENESLNVAPVSADEQLEQPIEKAIEQPKVADEPKPELESPVVSKRDATATSTPLVHETRVRPERSPSPVRRQPRTTSSNTTYVPYDQDTYRRAAPPPRMPVNSSFSSHTPVEKKTYSAISPWVENATHKYRNEYTATSTYRPPAAYTSMFDDIVNSGPFSMSLYSTSRLLERSRSRSREIRNALRSQRSASNYYRYTSNYATVPIRTRDYSTPPLSAINRAPSNPGSFISFMDYSAHKQYELARSSSRSSAYDSLSRTSSRSNIEPFYNSERLSRVDSFVRGLDRRYGYETPSVNYRSTSRSYLPNEYTPVKGYRVYNNNLSSIDREPSSERTRFGYNGAQSVRSMYETRNAQRSPSSNTLVRLYSGFTRNWATAI